MESDFGVIAILLVIFGSLVVVIKSILNASIWKKLIANNLATENTKLPNLSSLESDRISWAKWGIVIIAFGAALLILEVLPFRISENAIIGVTSVFVGVAFIISYFISERHKKNNL